MGNFFYKGHPGEQPFCTGVLYRHRKLQCLHNGRDHLSFLLDRLTNGYLQVRSGNGYDQPGDTASSADVKYPVADIDKPSQLKAIDHVTADKFLIGGVSGKIYVAVPIPKELAVVIELFRLLGIEHNSVLF